RQALSRVPPRTRQRGPHRARGAVTGPDEERPSPVPAPPEIFGRAAPRGRPPEEHEVARRAERLRGVGEAARLGQRQLMDARTASCGEIDRNHLAPRRLQRSPDRTSGGGPPPRIRPPALTSPPPH